MSLAGNPYISLTLREAALKSGCTQAELIRSLTAWACSRRSAEFAVAWDRNCGPDGLVMIRRKVCASGTVPQRKRSPHTDALRQFHADAWAPPGSGYPIPASGEQA